MDNDWIPVPATKGTVNPLLSEAGYGNIDVINITNGGSGYWPLPYNPNPGASPSPVPANQQGAIVVISTGFVVNLMYR